ncbi:MAG TPA: glycosyltransferase family 39 protein [Candidatus Eisenbacteria bacterium]|nr:glycosyltransferase family 39 protein [Candidatus Eisenbacteria bacterium]
MTPSRTDAIRRKLADIAPILAIALAFAFTLFWKAGSITPSFDEMIDSVIAGCHQRHANPYYCNADITQGRLPYIVHASIRSLFPMVPPRTVDLAISGIAAVALLLVLSLFVRREFGRRAAVITALLIASSAPMLAAGRMTMTHSNVLFALLTALSFVAFVRFLRSRDPADLFWAAAAFGASVAANLLGVATAALFLFLFAMPSPDRRKDKDMASFLIVAIAAFFILSPAHLAPENVARVLAGIKGIRGVSTNHDYFGTGMSVAPRWYPFLLYAVKLSPWWAPWMAISWFFIGREKDRVRQLALAAIAAFIVLSLALKASLRYDAPHHHVHLIALGCVLVAYAADRAIETARKPLARAAVLAALAASFVLQIVAVAQVFPNMLFYGAQFGPRFIGEFYGPAVIQCQDQGKVRAELRRLIDEGKDVRTMATVCWGAPDDGDLVSTWWEAKPHAPGEGDEIYVFGEWVLFSHFHLTADQAAMRERILAECARHTSSDFPFLKDVYVIYRCPADPALESLTRLAPLDRVTPP